MFYKVFAFINSLGTGRKMVWIVSQGALSFIPSFVSTITFYKYFNSLGLSFLMYEREGFDVSWTRCLLRSFPDQQSHEL